MRPDPAWPHAEGPRFTRRTAVGTAAAGAATLALPRVARAARVRSATPSGLPSPASIHAADPADLTLTEAASLLQARRLSSTELTRACLERIHARDGAINAWVRTYPELALDQAARADRRLARRVTTSPLAGVPIGLKDLYAVAGLPLTASSKVLAGNVARGDSTVWKRLRAAGMVLLGHTHTDEFAFGVGTPQTSNPWDTSRSPGGSSGGSGAALGARMTPAATGTDTGGSLRSPANACGVTSLKPSFGLVSAHGVIPLVWSRDHPGPMGHSAADVALLLGAMAGPDPDDPATFAAHGAASLPLAPRKGTRPLAGRRLGVDPAATSGLPDATAKLFARFLDDARALGAEVVTVADPGSAPSGAGDQAETWSYHQQFGPAALAQYRAEIAAAVLACRAQGTAPALGYIDFERDRLRYMHAWQEHFRTHRLDAVLKPGSALDGATREDLEGITVLSGSVSGDYRWANYAGLPVALTPVGRSAATGMPFGVQVGAPPHAERALLQLVIDYQAHHPYWRDAPKDLA